MSQLEEIIKRTITKLSEKSKIKTVISGKAVNVKNTTCDVVRENAPTLYDVRLNAVDDDLQNYFTVIPVENSNVLVAVIEDLKTEAVVVRVSEVGKVLAKVGDNTMMMSDDGFVFNDGNISGLVKLPELVKWMQKVYNDLQTLKMQLQSHPVAGNGAVLALPFNVTVTNPVQRDFEDKKVKH